MAGTKVVNTAEPALGGSVTGSASEISNSSPLKKTIVKRRRVRNRFGPDPSYMGFTKSFFINKTTGRANQLLRCLRCSIKTSKMCNMIDHIKTH